MSEEKSSGFFSGLFGKGKEPLPGTTITKEELASAISEAIQQSFEKHIPQPADMAEAIKGAVTEAGKQTAGQVAAMQKQLADSQKGIVEQSNSANQAAIEKLQLIESSLAKNMDAMNEVAGRLQTILQEHIGALDKSLAQIKSQVDASLGAGKEQLQPVFAEHAANLKQANQELAAQLQNVTDLGKDIKQVLHIQEVVDGTLQSVTTSEAFQKLMDTLREHLEESDKLLREVSKPRTIRLVEQDVELTEEAAPSSAEG